MRAIKDFLRDNSISATIIGVVLTTLFVCIGTAFSYVASDAKIKEAHSIRIIHLEENQKEFKDITKKINDNLINIKLDIREIKTIITK